MIHTQLCFLLQINWTVLSSAERCVTLYNKLTDIEKLLEVQSPPTPLQLSNVHSTPPSTEAHKQRVPKYRSKLQCSVS